MMNNAYWMTFVTCFDSIVHQLVVFHYLLQHQELTEHLSILTTEKEGEKKSKL